tara:strand:- start:169 stop:1761 length:1593 start_codon:yes stop_codon:yes gene_type:complete
MTKANINKFKATWIMICVIALLALNPTANVLAQVNEDQEEPESINFDKAKWKERTDYLLKKYRLIDNYMKKELQVGLDTLLQDIEGQEKNFSEEIDKIYLKIENDTKELILPQLEELEKRINEMDSVSKENKTNVNENKTSITGLKTELNDFKAKQLETLGELGSIKDEIQEINQWENQQENFNTSSEGKIPAESRSTWGIINNLQFILIVILIICLIALCVIAYIHLLHGPYRNRSVSRTKTPNEGYSEHVQTYSYQPKEINKSNLISWWNENGAKPPSSCSKSLEEEFGNNCSHKFIRKGGSDKNDWKLIKIRETKSSGLYVLPRKDSPYKDNIIEKWFITEDKEVKANAYIVSLIEPAKTIQGRDETISKGTVKISEIKSRSEEKLTDVGKKSDIANRAITEPETKPFTKNNLIDWWDKNSAKTYTKCKDIIKEEFGNNTSIEAIEYNPNDKEEWYLIGIAENTSSEFYYVLPRKYDFTVSIKNWFEAKEGSTSRDASISSLKKLAMMQANITPRTPSAKGEVTLKF